MNLNSVFFSYENLLVSMEIKEISMQLILVQLLLKSTISKKINGEH